jgi:hypothetical protein
MKRTLLAAVVLVAGLQAAPAQALEIDKPGCIYVQINIQQVIVVECKGKLHDILNPVTRKPLKKLILQTKNGPKTCWVLPRTKKLLCV